MNELRDFLDDGYDPAAIRARVGHLPPRAQQEIEQISRILRAAFGYGGADVPAPGRIVRIALTGPCADQAAKGGAIAGYDFHINVNLPECADEAHWLFARRLIASEIGVAHPVTLIVEATDESRGIILYDAEADFRAAPHGARHHPPLRRQQDRLDQAASGQACRTGAGNSARVS